MKKSLRRCAPFLVAMLICAVLSPTAPCPAALAKAERNTFRYKVAFNPTVLSDGAEKTELPFANQEKLLTCTVGDSLIWSEMYVPAEYLSQTADDLGAIIVVSEREQILGTYTNGAKVYKVMCTVSLLDPYQGVVIDSKVFGQDIKAPETTYGSHSIRPNARQIASWVEGVWAGYLLTGTAKTGAAPVTDFDYAVSGLAATIGKYNGDDSIVGIPCEIEGRKVTRIGDFAFSKCSGVTRVTVPEGVVTIGKYAFSNCGNLQSISIPGSVSSIGEHAFTFCSALEKVSIPEGVTSIGDSTFFLCSGLTDITIPASVRKIGIKAFAYCGFSGITLPEGISTIEADTFYYCKSLISVTLPQSVVSIGNGAFSYCESLAELVVPASVTSISRSAFDNSPNLTVVCPSGSYAQSFCEEYGVRYRAQ